MKTVQHFHLNVCHLVCEYESSCYERVILCVNVCHLVCECVILCVDMYCLVCERVSSCV